MSKEKLKNKIRISHFAPHTSNKGITLIALIITILVMLILTGVTVSVALGENGIINKALKAKTDTTVEIEREKLLDAVVGAINLEGQVDYGNLDSNLPDGFIGNEGIYVAPSSTIFKVSLDGKITIGESLSDITFNITNVQNQVLSEKENVSVKDEYGNEFKVPAGFKITTDANNVLAGIVIEDCTESATKGSQFVWIPVGEIKIDKEGTTIENPLERYSGEDDTKYGDQPITINDDTYDYKINVNTVETKAFKSSVKSNGGYYIGRYEARTPDGQRGSADKLVTATDTLTCKASDDLYNYVNYTDALRLSKEMYTGKTFSSNLVNSYAWDTALEYFETVTNKTTYSETASINQGSEEGKVNFCWKGTVGTGNEDKICNVYDMASNSCEWSTEVYTEGIANIVRGGLYSSTERKAGTRKLCDIDTEGFHTLTFRVVLYLNEIQTPEEEEIIEIPTLSAGNLLEGNYIKKLGETRVVIPEGFGIVDTTGDEEVLLANIEAYDTYITETNRENGIVIKDASGNEFVWIPVNDINSMVMCQSAKKDEICTIELEGDTLKCTKHDSDELAGKLYATATGNSFDSGLTGQTYNATSNFSEPTGLSESDAKEFNNMALSVAKNGGFYVGRYETGGFNESKVVSKQGRGTGARGDINSATWDTMYQKQKAFGNSTVGSSMIWGCQYDQVMKFVDGKNGFSVKVADEANRHSGSSTNGTGNTDADFAANIYDLEDNMSEWTIESYNGDKRVLRGGGYKTSKPASSRTGHGPTNSNSDVGSRMTLYIKAGEAIDEEPEYSNEEVLNKLGIAESTGTYNGTWTVIGVEGNNLKLVSTDNVTSYRLGTEDPKAIEVIPIEGTEATEQEKLERAIWSYKNAVNSLNTAAQEATGITTARSINIEDIETLAGIEDSDKGTEYNHPYTYNYTDHKDQIFVTEKGETVKIDSPEKEVKLHNTVYVETNVEIGKLASGRYWLASSCIECYSIFADFRVRHMNYGSIISVPLFSSNVRSLNDRIFGVRAVVEVPGL